MTTARMSEPGRRGSDHRGVLPRGPDVPAAGGVRQGRPRHRRPALRRGRRRLARLLGPAGRRAARLVPAVGHDPASGSCPSPSGSSAASSTSPTTASTATSPPGRGDRVAYHWEGEPGDTRTITYAELLDEVQQFANVLKSLGVERGDRVAIYMPMIPELPVAMLACARIGAAHSVVFGGFSADALRDRINDAEAKVLITADGGWRRGQRRAAQADGRRRARRRRRRSPTWSWSAAPSPTSP